MANQNNHRLKIFAKRLMLKKGIKLILLLLMTYGPAGIVGKFIKLLSSKWVINMLTKRLT
ncbi:hypothetical protein MASR2M36_18430 [Providencia sp.]